jgi:hypothetical protein
MCKERGKVPHPGCERSWSLEIGNLLVEGHEAYHSAPHDVAELPSLLFGSQEVHGSHAAWIIPPRDPPRIGGPCLPWSRAVGSSLALGAQLQRFGRWWSRTCLGCWVVTGGPRYPGYKSVTPRVLLQFFQHAGTVVQFTRTSGLIHKKARNKDFSEFSF